MNGKDRWSYANLACHSPNQAKVNADIRRVGNHLLLVLIEALPPNGEVFVYYGRGYFSRN